MKKKKSIYRLGLSPKEVLRKQIEWGITNNRIEGLDRKLLRLRFGIGCEKKPPIDICKELDMSGEEYRIRENRAISSILKYVY